MNDTWGQTGWLSSTGRRSALVLAMLTAAMVGLAPASARAQSAIAGVVKDTSGAVLPGVTVEAASPALIEKVRAAVTDGEGRYNIADLRPGTYTVTFALAGFNTVKRDGIDLPSSFVATVNADLPVGSLEETLTVSGQAPVVDTQSTSATKTLSKELLEAVPTGREVQNYTALIPGAVQAAGAQTALASSYVSTPMTFHGASEAQYSYDGFDLSHALSDRFQQAVNQATVQEVVVAAGNAGADKQAGGLVTNSIPKEGGNTFSGQMYAHYTNESFLGNNLTDALRAAGGATQSVRKDEDYNPALGGPILRDRLWFFGSYRYEGSASDTGSRWNADGPLAWTYHPDLTRRSASTRIENTNYTIRFTGQPTPRNKVAVYYDSQPRNEYNRSTSATSSPEAGIFLPYVPQYIAQATWKSPISNRLLLDAGAGYQFVTDEFRWNDREADSGLPVTPDRLATPATDLTTGINFRGAQTLGIQNSTQALRTRASVSYVTGTQTLKVGMNLAQGTILVNTWQTGDYTMSLRSGVPSSITLSGPNYVLNHLRADLGVYVQERWTMHKLTLDGGVRYDYYNTNIPAQDVRASRFIPARHFDPVDQVLARHDISPRAGMSYDVFGTGRTAIKATLSRYVALEGIMGGLTTTVNPVVTSVVSATRTFADANGNFIPDCNFSIPTANGECGALSNLNFGLQNPNATRVDPDILRGFGKRRYSWETTASLQHELVPGLAVNAGYFRRWFGNFTATDNTLVTPADFDPYCIAAPADSRLPGGGGNQICGLYDVKPALQGRTQNFVTFASNFGKQTLVFTAVDFTISARLPGGVQVSGGTDTSRTSSNTCLTIDSPQAQLFCNVVPPFQTTVKLVGTYPLPWWGLQASGAFQSLPGPEISAATYVASNAEIRPTLGRNLAAGATATVTLPLMQAGTVYGSQYNKLDIRFSKKVQIGKRRLTGSLDVFNILNGAGIAAINGRYGPSWQSPTTILGARLFRLSGQFDF